MARGTAGHSRALLVSLMAVALLTLAVTGASPVAAAGIRQLCVYVDSPSTPFSAGHVFVQLISNNVPGSRNQVYGLYPSTANIFGGAGVIQNDAARHWDWKICYDITLAQYNALVAFVAAAIAAPPAFNLFNSNCVVWASAVAATVGITLPTFNNRLGIPDPYAFQSTLSAAGNGAVIGGGTVHNNPGNVAPTASGDPPPECCSYDADAQYGISQPNQLASSLQISYTPTTEPSVTVGMGDTVEVQVLGGTPSSSVIFVDWGDGTNSSQTADATHAYSAAGPYSAALVVINSVDLERESIPITVVSASTGPQLVQIENPSDSGAPTVYGENVPITPAPEGATTGVPEFALPAVAIAAIAFACMALLLPRMRRGGAGSPAGAALRGTRTLEPGRCGLVGSAIRWPK